MTPLVPIALFGWPIVSVVLFALLPARRAVISCLVGGWLFLPMYQYDLPGLPDYGKVMATSLGVLLGAVLFDGRRFLALRFRLIDLPAAVWCLCPLATSMSNDLGVYDGLSGSLGHLLTWGIPYLMGRLYFTDLPSLRELAEGIIVGGLIYVPLCLWEIRMSPQLHRILYGFQQHSFAQHLRFGGYRPKVFMQHGLAVAGWMASALVTAVGAWRCWPARPVLRLPWAVTVLALGTTLILCRSGNGYILAALGVMAWFTWDVVRTRVPLAALSLVAPVYMMARFTGVLPGEHVMAVAALIAPADRVESLASRVQQEDLFMQRTKERIWLGWGGWGRAFPVDQEGQRLVRAVDSLWVIASSFYGIVGVSAVTLLFLVPVVAVVRRMSRVSQGRHILGGAMLLAVLLVMVLIDNLFNAMVNPVNVVAAGALSGTVVEGKPVGRAVARLSEGAPE